MAAEGEVRIWLDRLLGSDESKGVDDDGGDDGDDGNSFSFVGEASDRGSMGSDSWTECARGLPVVSCAGEDRSTPSGG